MDIKLSEGFCRTIGDILDYCVEGHTDRSIKTERE